MKLFKFEIQKCGQILCAHKPYFLMPGHIYIYIYIYIYVYIYIYISRLTVVSREAKGEVP